MIFIILPMTFMNPLYKAHKYDNNNIHHQIRPVISSNKSPLQTLKLIAEGCTPMHVPKICSI